MTVTVHDPSTCLLCGQPFRRVPPTRVAIGPVEVRMHWDCSVRYANAKDARSVAPPVTDTPAPAGWHTLENV